MLCMAHKPQERKPSYIFFKKKGKWWMFFTLFVAKLIYVFYFKLLFVVSALTIFSVLAIVTKFRIIFTIQ